MGSAAIVRGTDLFAFLAQLAHPPMVDRRTEHPALGLHHRQARGHLQRCRVAAVAVDNQNARKTVVGQAHTDIAYIVDKGIPANRNRAGEIHVMGAIAVGHRGNEHRLGRNARHRTFTNFGSKHHIHINRQMVAMIFISGHGQNRHPARFHGLVALRPGHFRITIFHG